MERWVLQQTFPNWDSLRIMNSRGDHLAWMRRALRPHRRHRLGEFLAEVDAENGDPNPVSEK